MPKQKAKSKCQSAHRRFVEEAECDGTVYCVGDSAYVILQPGEYDLDEEFEPCEVCGKVEKKRGRKVVPLLECDNCLRGFHLDCIDPPLSEVPKGDWICQGCTAGVPPPPPRAPHTARERFMAGEWSLVRIEAMWQEPDGSAWFAGRWYYRPEETHVGRQEHHGAREVFLTSLVDNNEMSCLERVVPVCTPASLEEFDGVNDVCTCEYEYDVTWQRFRRIAEGRADPLCEWACEDEDASEEDDDQAYKPEYDFWADKGSAAASQKGRSRGKESKRTRRHDLQGGEQWTLLSESQLSRLGLSAVPTGRDAEASELNKAQSALATTTAPKALPCRDAERQAILKFVEDAVNTQKSGPGNCLYISGVPGTGKTASVLEVIHSLRQKFEANPELPKFQFIEINSLRLPTPFHLYTNLLEGMTGQRYSPAVALSNLEDLFSGSTKPSRGRRMTVVLADEIDLLVTRKQEVLYNLFDWPTRKDSRLAVIGIANTMDLPERILPRIASRLGGCRIAFQPYSKQQLATIVTSKLREAGLEHVLATNAIGHACGKVAGVSGDLRRVLLLCRRACEVCENGAEEQVAMRHVNSAVEDMFGAIHMRMLEDSSFLEKILLAALLLQTRANGQADATMEEVATRTQKMLASRQELRVTFDDCQHAARKLASTGLLSLEGGDRLRARMSLNVSYDDVVYVLRNETAIPWLKDLVF